MVGPRKVMDVPDAARAVCTHRQRRVPVGTATAGSGSRSRDRPESGVVPARAGIVVSAGAIHAGVTPIRRVDAGRVELGGRAIEYSRDLLRHPGWKPGRFSP